MRNNKFRHCAFAVAALLYSLLFTASTTQAQTVVSRARIGGYSEDITYVSSGALKDNIVMLNGYEAYTVPAEKKDKGKESLTKLCDLKFPEFDQFPNGITYVESEGVFFVNQASQPTKLFVLDQTCALKGTRSIQYLNSAYRPIHMEGMAYIPASSATFPDHIIMVVWDDLAGGPNRLEIVRRDGVVASEIYRPDWPEDLLSGNIGDVAFLAPNRLLVTTYTSNIWTIDFSGNIISGPLSFPPETFGLGEGLVQLGDTRFVATSYPQSLIYFDKNLNRLADSDRHDVIGLNLNNPAGVTWNSDTNRLLISHDALSPNLIPRVASLPTSLDSATPVVNLSSFPMAREIAYLADEDLIAVLNPNPPNDRAILLYNQDGTLNSQVSLSPSSVGQNFGAATTLTYLPTTHEFIVGFNGGPSPQPAVERRKLRVFSRTGTLVRTIDLTATGTDVIAGLDYFDDPGGGGGRLIILGSAGRVFVTDLNGDSRNADGFLIREFNSRAKFGLLTRQDVAAITTGPLAGTFAIVDASGGEVVIFRLD